MSSDNTTRLFFALWPDPATRKRLTALQHTFSGQPGRFNHPHDLHTTLVFLGPVEAERMECVIAAAERVSPHPFSLLWYHARHNRTSTRHRPRRTQVLLSREAEGPAL